MAFCLCIFYNQQHIFLICPPIIIDDFQYMTKILLIKKYQGSLFLVKNVRCDFKIMRTSHPDLTKGAPGDPWIIQVNILFNNAI